MSVPTEYRLSFNYPTEKEVLTTESEMSKPEVEAETVTVSETGQEDDDHMQMPCPPPHEYKLQSLTLDSTAQVAGLQNVVNGRFVPVRPSGNVGDFIAFNQRRFCESTPGPVRRYNSTFTLFQNEPVTSVQTIIDDTVPDIRSTLGFMEPNASFEKGHVKIDYRPAFPRSRHMALDCSLDAGFDQTAVTESFSLKLLRQGGWYLPEFPEVIGHYCCHELFIYESELLGRQKLQHHYTERFPTSTTRRPDGRDYELCDYPDLPLFKRHMSFVEHFGELLHSGNLNPCFKIRLGSDLSVDFNSKAYGCQRLVTRCSTGFLRLLSDYIHDFLKALYAYIRGGYISSTAASLCKIDKLDKRLDELINALLTYPVLCAPGGFCITANYTFPKKS
ncbi:unnamed protein product [Oikopleura dioica]|uniref:Uncharacterized protein n=1 Tax=Oikopleura dioica TaxID=34765 RepID=E4XP84_OIKDI|nr:unnamed protein product [Oikopleura dioica]